MTTAEVRQEIRRLCRIGDRIERYHAVGKSHWRVVNYWHAIHGIAGEIKNHISGVHTDDLPALLKEPGVTSSKVKVKAVEAEIRKRAKRFRCSECERRFPTVEKTLLHKLDAHQKAVG